MSNEEINHESVDRSAYGNGGESIVSSPGICERDDQSQWEGGHSCADNICLVANRPKDILHKNENEESTVKHC